MGNGTLIGGKSHSYNIARNEELRRTARKKRYQKGVPGLESMPFGEALERISGMDGKDVRRVLSKTKHSK